MVRQKFREGSGMPAKKAAKRGRPALPADEKKLASIGFRPTPQIRRALEEAARQNGRSVSQEIMSRLEHSLSADSTAEHMLGFPRASLFAMGAFGNAVSEIEKKTGKSWMTDWATRERVKVAFDVVLHVFGAEDSREPIANYLAPGGRERARTDRANKDAGREAAISVITKIIPSYENFLVKTAGDAAAGEDSDGGKRE
jgi:hypothetical protein